MSALSEKIQEKLSPVLRAGDIDRCQRTVARQLTALPHSPFHAVVDLSFSNSPGKVAAFFDGFCRKEARRMKMAAAYAEMNGFDINPKRWHFSWFGFEQYGGRDDYGWLADWQSEDETDMTLTGMERLQEVYASPAGADKALKDARDLASLLVVIKFQDLIRRSAPHMRKHRFPLLATAHDYDFIFEIQPAEL